MTLQDNNGNYEPGKAIQSGVTAPSSGGSGNGAPVGTGIEGQYYVQKDSNPPGAVWWYYGGAWH